MKRVLSFPFLMILAAFSLFAWQEPKPEEKKGQEAVPLPVEYKIPPQEAKKPNPIKPTPASVDEGRRLFSSQCAMCHGEAGNGKGELAVSMGLTQLRDWTTAETLKGWTDGQLYYVMDKGKGHMPGQEGRMKTDQKWHLVNFIRSLSRQTEEKKP